MPNAQETHEKAPYLSFVTFKNFIEGLAEGPLPARIDKSVMNGQSGAVQSYLMGSLRFFALVDDAGVPSQSLKDLVAAAGNETTFRTVWRGIVEVSYQTVVASLDLPSATASQLHERLRELYDYNGETLRKCHSFFLAAYALAGVELGVHLKVVSRAPSGKKKMKVSAPPPAPAPAVPSSPADQLVVAASASGEDIATLKLDAAGKRVVRLLGPTVVTKEELSRIQQWLGFHFIVSSASTGEGT